MSVILQFAGHEIHCPSIFYTPQFCVFSAIEIQCVFTGSPQNQTESQCLLKFLLHLLVRDNGRRDQ